MKIKAIELNDQETPETITVTMTLDEAILIATEVGGVPSIQFTEKYGSKIGDTHHEIYSALVGSVFNRYWDDGVKEALQERRA